MSKEEMQEYDVETLVHELGIKESIIAMQKANISNQREIIDSQKRTIENLTKKLNSTEAMKLENKERELELDITYKTKKLETINEAIKKIEEEIIAVDDQYKIIHKYY